MSKIELFQALLAETLTVAANTIYDAVNKMIEEQREEFGAVNTIIEEQREELERTKGENARAVNTIIEEQREELERTKGENARLQRLLDLVFKPEVKLHRTEFHKIRGSKQPHREHLEYSMKMEQEAPEPPPVMKMEPAPEPPPPVMKMEPAPEPLVKVEQEERRITPESNGERPKGPGPSKEPCAVNPEGLEPAPVEMVSVMDKPKQRTMAECVRSTLFRGPQGELPDPALLHLAEVYKDFAADVAPLLNMDMSRDVPLVSSAFGMVPVGSPLSYQMPLPTTGRFTCRPDAPPPPPLPLDSYTLEPTNCTFVFSSQELKHLKSLETTWDTAHRIEEATREQITSLERERLRKPRLTTHLKDVCHVKGRNAAEHLADNILRGTGHREKRCRGVEPAAIWEYCRALHVNYSPCGFVIHPDAPWLGCSPYGLSFDPTESSPFGLVEIKFPSTKSYADCAYIKPRRGRLTLHHQHSYYWQVQGQLLITGLAWCDFVVFADDDMLIQRIYKDDCVANIIREKVDAFFFHFYMPRCMNVENV